MELICNWIPAQMDEAWNVCREMGHAGRVFTSLRGAGENRQEIDSPEVQNYQYRWLPLRRMEKAKPLGCHQGIWLICRRFPRGVGITARWHHGGESTESPSGQRIRKGKVPFLYEQAKRTRWSRRCDLGTICGFPLVFTARGPSASIISPLTWSRRRKDRLPLSATPPPVGILWTFRMLPCAAVEPKFLLQRQALRGECHVVKCISKDNLRRGILWRRSTASAGGSGNLEYGSFVQVMRKALFHPPVNENLWKKLTGGTWKEQAPLRRESEDAATQ